MNPTNIFIDTERAWYVRALEILAMSMGVGVDTAKENYKVFKTQLRYAVALSPLTDSYEVFLTEGTGNNLTTYTTESKMQKNDWFLASGIGVRIGRAAASSGVFSNHGNYPQFTYPDPNYFNGTGEATALQTLVNGKLTIESTGEAIMSNLLISEMVMNPDGTYTTSPAANPAFGGQNGRGILPLQPGVVFDGNAENKITFRLASGTKTNIDGSKDNASTPADTNRQTFVYIILDGYALKNAGGNGAQAQACRA